MKNHFVITIGRQYGSAGHEIGQKLAAKLGVKCYDKEILARAAKDSGLCEEIFEMHDEKPTNSFLYSLVMDASSYGYGNPGFVDMPINQKVFLAQFDSIKKLAKEESCIIVGRCADYALEEEKNVLSVFIHASEEARIKRIAGKYNMTEDKARAVINKTDKKRASYYNYYTNKRWGEAKSYHLSIDSSYLGIDGTIDFLYNFILNRFPQD